MPTTPQTPTTPTTPIISIQNVSKSFGKKQVLQNVTLNINPGATYAFLGRNGEGKTTTLRMLMGLLKPTTGEISVLNLNPLTQATQIRQQVGYLAEDQTMYPWMRVDEILRFIAPFYPNWDHDLALTYLNEFDLPPTAKIRQLSKGQNVRLGLILALAHRPKLVILDDPALGLDPIMRKQFNKDLINNLQSQGSTILYSSHLLHEVEPVADRVAILHQGTIIQEDTTENLRNRVKRIILNTQIYNTLNDTTPALTPRALSTQTAGDEIAITLDNPDTFLQSLTQQNIPHQIQNLNLDEIFEAFVTTTPTTSSNNSPTDDSFDNDSAPPATRGFAATYPTTTP